MLVRPELPSVTLVESMVRLGNTTLATALARLLLTSRSTSLAKTRALFVMKPATVGAVITTVALAEPLLVSVPRLQNTTLPRLVQPPGATPDTKVAPAGSWLEITTLLATPGPRLVTWKVRVSGLAIATVAGVLVRERFNSTRFGDTQQLASLSEMLSTYQPPAETDESEVKRQRKRTVWPTAAAGRVARVVMKPPELPRQLVPLLYPPWVKLPPRLVRLLNAAPLMESSRNPPSQQDSVL